MTDDITIARARKCAAMHGAGFDAHKAGLPRNANPHAGANVKEWWTDKTKFYHAWNTGWDNSARLSQRPMKRVRIV